MLRSIGKQSEESGISPGEEKEGCGGKDLQKMNERVMGWWMMRVVSRWNRWRKCHSKNWVNQNWRD